MAYVNINFFLNGYIKNLPYELSMMKYEYFTLKNFFNSTSLSRSRPKIRIFGPDNGYDTRSWKGLRKRILLTVANLCTAVVTFKKVEIFCSLWNDDAAVVVCVLATILGKVETLLKNSAYLVMRASHIWVAQLVQVRCIFLFELG